METEPQPANSHPIASAWTSHCPVDRVDHVRDEAQMIVAVLNGQASVFADLVRPYEPVLYRVAFSILRNQADAEDVTQELSCGHSVSCRVFDRKPGSAPGSLPLL